MYPGDMTASERREYPQGRCGKCGANLARVSEWEGDDYGFDLLCLSCGRDIQKARHRAKVEWDHRAEAINRIIRGGRR